ncbi:MAG TPA: DedA family protein/thiosulfate sulfurtransferase GlpE [Bryobacteraceae bacterium]|jgi:membrane protein DedA with SNARE-associated domain/rhodanese-related sulfurtransferase|nr:DedA family protein/thiosulfate sulfurtransferase GlpE [Bryobacteraceae bacterium]
MHELSNFLIRNGYLVLGGIVLVEQSGLPLPSVPLLLVMGALCANHQFSFLIAWLICIVAASLGDLLWYLLGYHRGGSILNLLCRISLEPDSCVTGAKGVFARWGAGALLFSKFVPGFGAVVPAMAGWTRVPRGRVMMADLAGSLLWSGAYLGAGAIFRTELEAVGLLLGNLGGWLVALVIAAVAIWLSWKYWQRRRFLRSLRVDRLSPDELSARIEAKEPVVVVDLRSSLELEADPAIIPGAIHIDYEQIADRFHELPENREVVLYCSCPNEASSAVAAMRLLKLGVPRVRPLEGGIIAWREKGYPVDVPVGLPTGQ